MQNGRVVSIPDEVPRIAPDELFRPPDLPILQGLPEGHELRALDAAERQTLLGHGGPSDRPEVPGLLGFLLRVEELKITDGSIWLNAILLFLF